MLSIAEEKPRRVAQVIRAERKRRHRPDAYMLVQFDRTRSVDFVRGTGFIEKSFRMEPAVESRPVHNSGNDGR